MQKSQLKDDELVRGFKDRRYMAVAVVLLYILAPVSIGSALSNCSDISSAMSASQQSQLQKECSDLLQTRDLHEKHDHYYVHHWPDPVNVRNGNLCLYYQDLHIPFFNVSIDIIRVYNSRAKRTASFGYGWTSNFDVRLEVIDDNRIQVFESNGAITGYSKESGLPNGDTYISSTRKSKIVYSIANKNYLRIRSCGYSETFGTDGLLIKWQDRDGHFIRYIYEKRCLKQIEDAAGRRVILSHNQEGFVDEIKDPSGRIFRYYYDNDKNLIKVVRPGKIETCFSYDGLHNLTRIGYPDGAHSEITYDLARDLVAEEKGPGAKHTVYSYAILQGKPLKHETRVQDSMGSITRYIYEAIENGMNLTIVDAQGARTSKEYDKWGNLVSYIDPNGNHDRFTYDNSSRLIKMKDPYGSFTEFSYVNSCGNQCPATITDTAGNVYRFQYDSQKRLITATNPAGLSATIHYAPSGLISGVTDYKGDTTRFEFSPFGDLTRVTNPSGTVAKILYDALGRIIETNYEDAIVWRFFYDEPGRLARVEGPSSYMHRFFYDNLGRLIESENAKGNHRKIVYDDAGQVAALTNEAGDKISFRYNPNGKCISIKDARGNTRELYFDSLNRTRRMVDPEGSQKSYRYDAAGNIIGIKDQDENEYKIAYDNLYRPIAFTLPNGDTTSIRYNSAGKKASITYPNNRRKYYQYDEFNRRTGIIHPSGLQFQYKFNTLGQISELVDEAGRTTHFAYDTQGNVTEERDISGSKRQYTYDDFGRVIFFKNEKGNVRHLKYDSFGRLVEVIQKDANSGEAIKELKFRYDILGFCIRTETGEGFIACKYDKVGNLIEVRDSISDYSIKYSYDKNGNREALYLNDEKALRYTFDTMNRLRTIHNLWGEEFIFEYGSNGRKSKLKYPNGVVAHYSYDSLLRLNRITYKDRYGKTLLKMEYAWDCMNNITEVRENGQLYEYNYDDSNRLVKVTQPNKSTISYKYDLAGNLINCKTSGQKETNFTYNRSDQLLEAGYTKYGYDQLGNLTGMTTNGQPTHFQYDPDDMLTKVTFPDSKEITYKYDAVGRRSTKIDNESITHYVYDLNDLLCILDRDKTIRGFITHGPGIDTALAIRENGRSYFYITDLLGSVRMVTDAAGNIVQELEYEPFGKNVSRDLGIALPYRFAGRVFDTETGLYYFRNRYYMPGICRFIQKDPIEYLSSTSNYYVFAANNPISRKDPLGLFEGAAEWIRQTIVDHVNSDDPVETTEPWLKQGIGDQIPEWLDVDLLSPTRGSNEENFARQDEAFGGGPRNSQWRPYTLVKGAFAWVRQKFTFGVTLDGDLVAGTETKIATDFKDIDKPSLEIGLGASREKSGDTLGRGGINFPTGTTLLTVDENGNLGNRIDVKIGPTGLRADFDQDGNLVQGEATVNLIPQESGGPSKNTARGTGELVVYKDKVALPFGSYVVGPLRDAVKYVMGIDRGDDCDN